MSVEDEDQGRYPWEDETWATPWMRRKPQETRRKNVVGTFGALTLVWQPD